MSDGADRPRRPAESAGRAERLTQQRLEHAALERIAVKAATAAAAEQVGGLRDDVAKLAATVRRLAAKDDDDQPLPIDLLALPPEGQSQVLDELSRWLDGWLRVRHAKRAKDVPRCWIEHPSAVEEVLACWEAWVGAYTRHPGWRHGMPAAWLRTDLPAMLTRVEDITEPCRRGQQHRPDVNYLTG